jgi:hypothetical protein
MMPSTFVFLLGMGTHCAALREAPPPRPQDVLQPVLPVQGVVRDGRVYTLLAEKQGKEWRAVPVAAPLRGGEVRRCPPVGGEGSPIFDWCVAHDRLWFAGRRTTVFDDAVTGGFRHVDCLFLRDLRAGRKRTGTATSAGKPIWPLPFCSGGVFDPLFFKQRLARFRTAIHYGFVPTGDDELLFFLLVNVSGKVTPEPLEPGADLRMYSADPDDPGWKSPKWSFTVYHFRNRWSPRTRRWGDGVWAKRGPLPVRFKERFHAVLEGEDYYFLTRSGKVYHAPAAAKGKPRAVHPVWEDRKRPVVALITDADTHRSFLFCRQGKGEDRPVYFELAAKAKPRPYDLTEVEQPKVKEPLRSALHYARWLDRHKLLGKKDRGAPTPRPSRKAP